MATIYIHPDEVYRTRVENIINPELFFYPVYQQARDCLDNIVQFTRDFWIQTEHGSREMNPLRLRGYPNNIIAFCADRGYGKTSAMLSFSAALDKLGRERNGLSEKAAQFWPKGFEGKRFLVLEPIDPTILRTSEALIPTVITRMFSLFTKHAQKIASDAADPYCGEHSSVRYGTQQIQEQKRSLLRKFQNCYRLAGDQSRHERWDEGYDDLQQLADRSDSSNFKLHFSELIGEFLKFMAIDPNGGTTSDSQNFFLVIQIDDADMNPEFAYDVVEDMRRYCVLPNIVVLFATDLDHLSISVEQHFLKSFDAILRVDERVNFDSLHTATKSRTQCHHTTVSYLDKLIPSLHRINLPNINDALLNHQDQVKLNHPMFYGNCTPEEANEQEGIEYQSALIQQLKNKCGIQLFSETGEMHPFLPKRMRELTHFLSRLAAMKDVSATQSNFLRWALGQSTRGIDYEQEIQNLQKNLESMLDYLVHDWSELRLESWQQTIIKDIHKAEAGQKLSTAVEFVKMNPKFSTVATRGKPVWSALVSVIQACRSQQAPEFACALEIYFELYKELLIIYDCCENRGKKHE